MLFLRSSTTTSGRVSQFDTGEVILFVINKVFVRQQGVSKKELRPSFTQLIAIRWMNRVHGILKWQLCSKDSVISPSYLNFLDDNNDDDDDDDDEDDDDNNNNNNNNNNNVLFRDMTKCWKAQ